MATPAVLQRRDDLVLLQSPLADPRAGDLGRSSRGVSIEKKIEFLESLAGQVSNRRSRRWINDRLLMELVPRLNAEEIRGLFSPPPWGDEVPPSTFSQTNVQEWDNFRNIDMDKEANILDALKTPSRKPRGHVDCKKMAALNAWRRVNCRTRDALRRSFVLELVEGYEECIREFIAELGEDTLELQIQDAFHRLLLHGVCEFYGLGSVTMTKTPPKGSEPVKVTRITKKKSRTMELPSITLTDFLRMSKEGTW
ncbi:hypothetical protein MLD38_021621 [Melastoma candidum]|uniref:Uncharacterized protein n=1 Tax=Melastoma candidum TaxID=119954 RepID=A0ACB9QGV6_9MYRT|nr:hypothetical protein MLD38_021621 [Melastoma candidum]